MRLSGDDLKKRLFSIWEETGVNDDEWAPLVPHPPKESCVLFVGLNPSFSKRAWEQAMRQSAVAPSDPFKELRWGNRNSIDTNRWTEIEEQSRQHYSYFRVFRDFSNVTGMPWDHVDLFQFRHTNQKHVEGRLIASADPIELTRFGNRQLEVSRALIRQCRPQAVVVVNALGSRVLLHCEKPSFDTERGCHLLLMDGAEVPVFFSSMLTGQRALDVFSRARLFWHVCRVLDVPFKAEAWGV